MRNFQKSVLLLSVLILTFCQPKEYGTENQNMTYQISGTIDFNSEKPIYLQEIIESNAKIVDSIIPKTSKTFEFKGKLKEYAFYRILFNENVSIFPLNDSALTVSIKGSEALPLIKIKGTKQLEDFQTFNEHGNLVQNSFDSLNQLYIIAENLKNQNQITKINKSYQKLSSDLINYTKKSIQSNQKSIVSVYKAGFLDKEANFTYLDSLSNDLKSLASKSSYIQTFLTNIEKMKKLSPGGFAPNFTGNTPDGRKISLADYKGKVVMIDFWASWCGPCRQANPEVVKMYLQFKDKNFDILGVSLDSDADKWKTAIQNDGLTWQQVSDLNGWDSEFAVLYQVESIPQTFLIGKDGKIIAKNLFGAELENKLKEIL